MTSGTARADHCVPGVPGRGRTVDAIRPGGHDAQRNPVIIDEGDGEVPSEHYSEGGMFRAGPGIRAASP